MSYTFEKLQATHRDLTQLRDVITCVKFMKQVRSGTDTAYQLAEYMDSVGCILNFVEFEKRFSDDKLVDVCLNHLLNLEDAYLSDIEMYENELDYQSARISDSTTVYLTGLLG